MAVSSYRAELDQLLVEAERYEDALQSNKSNFKYLREQLNLSSQKCSEDLEKVKKEMQDLGCDAMLASKSTRTTFAPFERDSLFVCPVDPLDPESVKKRNESEKKVAEAAKKVRAALR